jgi:exonuclease SbcD
MDQVRRRFPHTLELRFDPEGVVPSLRSYAARVASRSELDVCCDFLGHVRSGAEPDEDERALLAAALDAARTARRRADDEGVADLAARVTGAA